MEQLRMTSTAKCEIETEVESMAPGYVFPGMSQPQLIFESVPESEIAHTKTTHLSVSEYADFTSENGMSPDEYILNVAGSWICHVAGLSIRDRKTVIVSRDYFDDVLSEFSNFTPAQDGCTGTYHTMAYGDFHFCVGLHGFAPDKPVFAGFGMGQCNPQFVVWIKD